LALLEFMAWFDLQQVLVLLCPAPGWFPSSLVRCAQQMMGACSPALAVLVPQPNLSMPLVGAAGAVIALSDGLWLEQVRLVRARPRT
jgi:hypothetical protein